MGNEIKFAREPLQQFVKEVLQRLGLPPADAEIEADILKQSCRQNCRRDVAQRHAQARRNLKTCLWI